MAAIHCRPCLQGSGLQLNTKRESSYCEQRRPTTPGSPQHLEPFSLPLPNYASRIEAYPHLTKVDLQSLGEKLGSLPQELYDQVLLFTLACDGGREVFPSPIKKGPAITNAQYVNDTYQPPVQLAINQKNRKDALQKYYRDTTFIFSDQNVLQQWMQSLCEEAMEELTDARFIESSQGPRWLLGSTMLAESHVRHED